MEHHVSECKSCRLLGWEDGECVYFCDHPVFNMLTVINNIPHETTRTARSTVYTPITPDWCPLKTEPLTIIFSPNKTT